MKLQQLLEGIEYELIDKNGGPVLDKEEQSRMLSVQVQQITNDSRKVTEGCLFFCISGARSDGHAFAQTAAEAGAAVLIVEKPVDIVSAANCPVIVKVSDSRYAMALISAAYYRHPAGEMKMIGITGTKGKTTTTYLIRSMLQHAGINTGLIGTIESAYNGRSTPAANTTPESIVLQRTLREMADAGVKAVVMEVSSQALKLHRTAGIEYDLAVFTNISPDHIGPNEHASFEEYMECKSRLFRQAKVGIVNGDDPHTKDVLKGHTCKVESFGLQSSDDLYADHAQLIKKPGELGIAFDTEGLTRLHAEVPTPGSFSIYNALAAIAVCLHFDVPAATIEDALKTVHVRGRVEMVPVSSRYTLLIDYAHNAVALESLLTTLREYQPHRLVTLFGCGGNRSKLRRYEMGEVSGKLSDLTIITSDNPRFEDPMDIIHDIETGMNKTSGQYVEIPDRKEAIRYAMHHAEDGDIVILAGKGHEDYQEIQGVKHPMDERVLIREIMEEDAKADSAKVQQER